MTDEELIARLRSSRAVWENGRSHPTEDETAAAERIEALTKERDEHWNSFVHWRKEADDRAEQLTAARQDAKEAKAYAEELEAKVKSLTKHHANMADPRYWEGRYRDEKNLLAKAVEALTPLAAIADAFDANELDDEARKFWGKHSVNTTPHEDIELYQGRGGRQLLTLANCMFARATLAEIKGESHD